MIDESKRTIVTIYIFKGLGFLYSVVTYPFLFYFGWRNLQESNKLKAKRLGAAPTTPYRCVQAYNALTTTLFTEKTVDDLYTRALEHFKDQPCLGYRELLSEEDEPQPNGKIFKKVILADHYKWLTYDQVNTRMTNLGSGLLALGLQPRSRVVIFAETRAEWMISVQACFRYNFTVVTLYSTLGDEAIIHAINETEVTHVITSNELLPKFKTILHRMPRVKHLIYMDQGKKPDTDGFNADVHSMTAVEQLGQKPINLLSPITKPTRDDIAVIMYTSGSTGLPKGVLITHANMMCGMSGQCERIPELGQRPDDIYIGYLPLAHVLELTAEISCVGHGTPVGYSSPQTLSDQSSKIKKGSRGDSTILKPTLMAAVPLIMDRLYKNVWDKVSEGGRYQRAVFKFAYDYKLKSINRGLDTPILNRMVFKKVRAILGGRVRLMLSGGAPLSSDTQRFMNVCFCCPVLQGYGLTETVGAGTVALATDISCGRVGPPLTCTELMLRDWEEGGYRTTDLPCPRGEILLGGGNITMGYFKNEAKTLEDFMVVNGQRWFCSGDIGEFHADGSLKIIDRKKDLVKLQAGEYVSLAKIETAITTASMVDSACVYADSSKMYTVCLIVPSMKHIRTLAQNQGVEESSNLEVLCRNKKIEEHIHKIVVDACKKGKLQPFEIPKRISLVPDMWTPDSGLVTDAFKLKRRVIQQKYQSEINRMYSTKG